MTPKLRVYLYLGTVSLFALAMVPSGLMDLTLPQTLAEGMHHLGYPDYVVRLLGVWKLAGVAVLLAPGLPRLKEWAYAGFMFDLTGAAVSHTASGAGFGRIVLPLVFLGLGLASWALRPAGRRLPDPETRAR